MKPLNSMITIIALVLVTGLSAQTDNKQVVNESKVNKFSVKSEKETIHYVVKVDTKSTGYIKMDDLSKKEETRLKDKHDVITTINVNANGNPLYNNAFTLSYQSYKDDTVAVIPTKTGFNINVAGEVLQYDFIQKVCDVPEGCPIQVNMISVTNK